MWLVPSTVRGWNNNVDNSRQVQALIYRLTTELLTGLTFGNTLPVEGSVRCDLNGETWIELAVGNDPMTPYATPSYADALMAPIVTTDRNNFTGIVRDFNTVLQAMSENDTGSNILQSNESLFRV